MKKKALEQKIQRQRAITEAARAENRDLTPEELREFNTLQGEIDTLKPQVEEEERQAAEQERQQAVTAERQRISDITALCREFDLDPAEYIKGGQTIDAVRTAVLDHLRAHNGPASAAVTRDEVDKFRAAASDALVMRTGFQPEHPAEGASDLRGMSLRDLAIQSIVRSDASRSYEELMRRDKTELYDELARGFFTPSASFPAILDTAIQKNIVHIYNGVNTTFQLWVRTGTLTDFKRTDGHSYLIGGAGDLLLVPENGELKADVPSTEKLPTRKLDTYGRQFSMSRQAFINDDIGFLSEVPGLYAAKAKRQINKACYDILYGNAAIYDGKALFSADHKNLVTTGAQPTIAAIQTMLQALALQTDPFGDAINITPAGIILPVGFESQAYTSLHSQTVNTSDNQQAANPIYNKALNVVTDATLNTMAGASACPWFMFGAQTDVAGVQVDYLNGQDTPTFRRMETPGVLGFTWDIYLDWGITVMDFRGLVKNPGVAIPTI
jgi:hypothetical protein